MPQYIIKLVQHVMVNFNGQIITMFNGTMIYVVAVSFNDECLLLIIYIKHSWLSKKQKLPLECFTIYSITSMKWPVVQRNYTIFIHFQLGSHYNK